MQVERIRERFPDIEIVKVYHATFTNIAQILDEMEEVSFLYINPVIHTVN